MFGDRNSGSWGQNLSGGNFDDDGEEKLTSGFGFGRGSSFSTRGRRNASGSFNRSNSPFQAPQNQTPYADSEDSSNRFGDSGFGGFNSGPSAGNGLFSDNESCRKRLGKKNGNSFSRDGEGRFAGGSSMQCSEKGLLKCHNCDREGHFARECAEPRRPRESGKDTLTRGGICFSCQQEGHLSKECPNVQEENKRNKGLVTYVPREIEEEKLFEEEFNPVGDLFHKFFEAAVKITRGGHEINVNCFDSFEDACLTPQVALNVRKAKYEKLTPVQKYTMPLIEQGRDLMTCAQTGSGKTAAFLLPIMSSLLRNDDISPALDVVSQPRCIIVEPTRELALQTSLEARKFAVGTACKCGVAYGGVSVGHQKYSILGVTVLVATIGRLVHFIEEGIISLSEVKYLVIDEADRMLDMGFEADMNKLLTHKDVKREKCQIVMFSATFPTEVQMLARRFLREDFDMITVDRIGSANKCIKQTFIETKPTTKKDELLKLLNVDLTSYKVEAGDGIFKKKTLVFVNAKKFADILGGIICHAGIPAITIHGDREQHQREEALNSFRRGKTPVLIATAVAERGLDICNVDHVINYDLPDNRQDYVHRIGRTGRVGNEGRATSFYDPQRDAVVAKGLVEVLKEVEQDVPEFLLRDAGMGGLRATMGFCEKAADDFVKADAASSAQVPSAVILGDDNDDW